MAEQRVSLVLSVTGQQQFEKAARSINKVEQAANKIQGTGGKVGGALRGVGAAASGAIPGVSGLGAALTAALGPLAAITSAAALVGKALNTAFERGAAEQKLRNFTSSTEEYNAALAVAADTANKFGMSQTEATAALADTYSRLKGLGFGLKETSEIYSGFQSIVLQSGTTAEDAAGAFLQLSQALGSGKLQGDELRAILERMPQLAQRIADSMGVSAGEIRKMGQEGKITSEIIYKALSEAGDSADEFGNKLNDQQLAMKGLAAAADQAFAQIGEVLSPVVIGAAELLAKAVQTLSDWWAYLGDNVLPKIQAALKPLSDAMAEAFEAIDWQYILNIVQNGLLKAFELMIPVIRGISEVLGFVVKKFVELYNSPLVQALLTPLKAVLDVLGLTGNTVTEWKEEQDKVTDATAKTVDKYSSLPPKVEDAKKKAKELKKAQDDVTKAISKSGAALDKAFQRQESAAELQATFANQRLQTEVALNNVLLEQAQRQLDGAKTAQQREVAARRIYELTMRQAQLEKAIAQAAIRETLRKAAAQVDYLTLKAKEIQVEVALAKAKGTANESHFEALKLAKENVFEAENQLKMRQAIAKEQMREVDAIYKGKEAAAKAAYEQNRLFEATKGAASAAGDFNREMTSAASATAAAATAASAANAINNFSQNYVPGQGIQQGGMASFEGSPEAIQRAFSKNRRKLTTYDRKTGEYSFDPSKLKNTRAFGRNSGLEQLSDLQQSVKDEEAKLQRQTAMRQWSQSNSASGEAVSRQPASINPTVNVTTGPVMQMDGSNYINQSDFVSGMNTASQRGAEMALEYIRSSGGMRRELGVG